MDWLWFLQANHATGRLIALRLAFLAANQPHKQSQFKSSQFWLASCSLCRKTPSKGKMNETNCFAGHLFNPGHLQSSPALAAAAVAVVIHSYISWERERDEQEEEEGRSSIRSLFVLFFNFVSLFGLLASEEERRGKLQKKALLWNWIEDQPGHWLAHKSNILKIDQLLKAIFDMEENSLATAVREIETFSLNKLFYFAKNRKVNHLLASWQTGDFLLILLQVE